MAGMTRPRRPQEVHIDRIVLPPGTVGTRRVRAAIERELARLLGDAPASADASLPAASVRVNAGTDADAIGVAVAKRIHLTLGRDKP